MTTTGVRPRQHPLTPARPSGARIPFSRLVAVEGTKATGTRAARWLLAATSASTMGLMLVPLLAPGRVEQTSARYLGFTAIGVTILLPLLSILTLTGEWSQRTAITTFTQESHRARVINAKLAVSVALALAGAAFGGLVTVAGLTAADVMGRDVAPTLSPLVIVGYLLFVLLNVMTGVVFGLLLQSSAAAVALYFALPVVSGLLSQALPSSAVQWVDTTTTFDWVMYGEWSGHTPEIAFSVVLWVIAPFVAGLVRTLRREVA
jgi:ABC-2 type transport system permease protein